MAEQSDVFGHVVYSHDHMPAAATTHSTIVGYDRGGRMTSRLGSDAETAGYRWYNTGLAGSLVSQAVGLATGIQDKFSWKGAALAALAGGIGGALGPGGSFGADGAFSKVGGSFAQGALRGAVGSVASQGIGLATGLQSRFDFAGAAVAGVVGGVGNWANARLPGAAVARTDTTAARAASFGNQLASGTASAIAGAASRSLVTGTSFGDNLLAVLPDVIGTTIGRAAGRAIAGRGGRAIDAHDHGAIESELPVGTTRTADWGLIPLDLPEIAGGGSSGANGSSPSSLTPQTSPPPPPPILASEADIVVTATRHMQADDRRLNDHEFGIIHDRAKAGNWEPEDENRAIHAQAHTIEVRRMALGGFSMTLDLLPFTGAIKAGWQMHSGTDPLTGERSGMVGNGIALASSILPVVGGVVAKGATRTAVRTSRAGAVKRARSIPLGPKPGSFNWHVQQLSEVGQGTVRTLQRWAKSKGWVKQAGDGPEVWGQVAPDGSFSWRLKVKPEASGRAGLKSGSQQPRFDARLDAKGTYVNPFTGQVGGKSVGTHLPLEYSWF